MGNKREWLMVILVTVTLLRVPTLFEPYWYGDEGIYLTIGQSLRSGEKLYTDIHDNKPPLLYWVAAAAGGNQFWFRMILAGWNLLTIGVFAKLAGKFWPGRQRAIIWSTWLFAAITNLPTWEGNIANAELFFLLPTISAMLILFDKQISRKKILLAGVVISLGGLFKIPALIEAGVWPLIWLCSGDKKWLSKSVYLALGAAIPWVVVAMMATTQGSMKEFVAAAFGQNINYLSAWKVGENAGIYALKGRLIVAAILVAIIYGGAKRIGRAGTIIGIWGTLTLFAVLLSGRPYPHYLLQMAGVVAVAGGLVWAGEKREKIAAAAMFFLIGTAYVMFNFYHYPTGSYYVNFAQWATGGKTTEEYYKWFDPNVNDVYKIARIVRQGSTEGDKIWVWGDAPTIYALANRLPVGKYVTRYHIKEFKAEGMVIKQLINNPPKYIVDYGNEQELPGLADLLEEKYNKVAEAGESKVFKLSTWAEMYN